MGESTPPPNTVSLEDKRGDALRRSHLLDSPREPAFEDQAVPIAEAPLGLDSLADEQRKSKTHLELLRTCVERLNDIVFMTEAEPIDEPGPRIVFVNEAFERI